jgi:hypothetical protein
MTLFYITAYFRLKYPIPTVRRGKTNVIETITLTPTFHLMLQVKETGLHCHGL